MPHHDDPIADRLRRDAAGIRPRPSAGFAERVRAARDAESCAESCAALPFPGPQRSDRAWWWLATAAAAALLLVAGWWLMPDGESTSDAPPITAEAPAPPAATDPILGPVPPSPAPAATPPSLAMLDLASLVPASTDPLGAEADAIREDLRHTGSFLLACLPGYPAPGH